MGALVNAIVIFLAAILGLVIKKGIGQRVHERLMEAIGLAVVAMGIMGVLKGTNTLVMILSLMIGALIGELLDLDQRLVYASQILERKLAGFPLWSDIDWMKGFISATMITCIGSMSIIGSLESGLLGDNTTLYTKSIIDGITAVLLASSLGPGVILSAFSVLIFEGTIILAASLLSPYLGQDVIAEIVCIGSILLIALGLNILQITHIKVLNYVPAIFLPILLMLIL